ncbi:MAG: methyltransferase [Candidatus Thorarchaeota archaeon]
MVSISTPKTSQDIEILLNFYLASAAVGVALELGLFWQLRDSSLKLTEISDKFKIPEDRCRTWLALLIKLGLVTLQGERYFPSGASKQAITDVYSHETWSFLAQEAREQQPAVIDLALHFSQASMWEAYSKEAPNYVTLMKNDAQRAERFTRMLYELHTPLAEFLAKNLNLSGVNMLMDLGGGSGVISIELMKQNRDLNVIVVDIANVCTAGRRIANETSVSDRITYFEADFLHDELPRDIDLVLECDVGVYTLDLFKKVLNSLNTNGRFIIVSNTDELGAWLLKPKESVSILPCMFAFSSSLRDPKFKPPTINHVKNLLEEAGFQDINVQIEDDGRVIIEGMKGG